MSVYPCQAATCRAVRPSASFSSVFAPEEEGRGGGIGFYNLPWFSRNSTDLASFSRAIIYRVDLKGFI